MKRTFSLALGLCLSVTFLNFERAAAQAKVGTSTPFSMGSVRLSARQAAGQLFMVGVVGTQVSPQMLQQMKAVSPGGVLLFKRNISTEADLRKLTSDLQTQSQSFSGLPLAIAVDQEGGPVSRLPLSKAMPSALALGRMQDPEIAFEVGYQVGQKLKANGITMNLAPVLDALPRAGQASFIGERSFGSEPGPISEMGLAFSSGLLQAGVVPTCKHFPGTSRTNLDPHVHSDIYSPIDAGLLSPFSDFLKKDLGAVMLSHELVTWKQEPMAPATVSKSVIQGLLRGQLGFKGPVLTDDLTMGALAKQGLLPEVALKALKAGVDLVMITWGPKEQFAAVERTVRAIRTGELSAADVQQKLNRIWSLKETKTERAPSQAPRSLEDLSQLILEKNIRLSLQKLSAKKWQEWSTKPLVAISRSSAFLQNFKTHLGRPMTTRLAISDDDLLGLNAPPGALLVIEADSPHVMKKINALPVALQKKILVLNETAPGRVNDQNLWGLVEINFKSEDLATALAHQMGPDRKPSSVETTSQPTD